jgi:hypothetical protein
MNLLIILGIGVLSLVTVAHYLLKADRSLVCRPPDFPETPCRLSRDRVPIIPRPRRDGAAESSSGDRHPVGTGQQGADYSKVFKWRSAPRRDGASARHSHIKSEALGKLAVILDDHA